MVPRLVVPAGSTFFDVMKHSFDNIEVGPEPEQGIPTAEFLDASESFTKLFHIAEGLAFTIVEKDMVGNITKLREVYLASPIQGATLQGLVNNELAAKKKKGTESLFWLTRALEFTSESINHSLENTESELTLSFTTMYQATLKPYHTWLMSKGFQAGLQTVPYRKDFFPKLGDDQDKVGGQAKDWLGGVNGILSILKPFIDSKKADLGIKG